MIRKYPAQIVSITNTISDLYTIEFKSTGKPFKYDPGQFLHLALDEYDPAAQWPDSRCFSMQSAPGEEMIRITYSVKGKFTNRMQQELKPGKLVTLKLPYGDLFTQEHIKVNTVFIAGGTGITPYLSLFTYSSFAAYNKPVLFAGFRNTGLNIYQDELEIAKQINSGVEIHLVYQDKNGILDIEKIYRQIDKDISCFISGPPLMISSFKGYLLKQGITEDQIKTDDWE